MVFRVLLALLLVTAATTARADAPVPAATVPRDALDAELAALAALPAERPAEGTAGAAQYLWFDGLCQRISRAAFGILEKHPDDPRRWRAALVLQQRRFQPRFVQSIGADYDTAGEKAVVRDHAAEEAWSARVDALDRQLRAAPDVPDEVREQVEFGDLMQTLMPVYQAVHEKQPVDLAKTEAALKAFLARWPGSESGRGVVPMYIGLVTLATGASENDALGAFADSPNRAARDYVEARRRFFALSKEPIELAFTAIDGRAVDLRLLRGKVVLIDFWATWCGPCIEELPNVKRTYAELHDKGFEVIGVSLDAEKDRKKFIDLVAKEGVAWPQRFEGKGWNDSLARKYTVSGIPAMFLLDQEGRLVSTNARGEKLGQEVRRLLKL